jgi:CRISPR-associated protein Csx16
MTNAPRTFFITRHSGARDWAARHGHQNAILLEHIEPPILQSLRSGDRVLGTLPVHLAAEVCRRGAHYLHLSIDIPPEARNRDLSADEMETFGARLEEFVITRV